MPDAMDPLQLDYGRPQAIRWREQRALVVVIILLGVFLLGSFLVSVVNRPRGDGTPRLKCASNLRQIGQALQMYGANEHGRLPDDLWTLLSTQDLSPAVFVCPVTNDDPASGATTQELAADFAKPGHVSYVYLGKGLTESQLDGNTVVAYEPLSNHGNTGMTVLFGEGNVEWVQGALAQSILSQASSGHRPVKLPPGH